MRTCETCLHGDGPVSKADCHKCGPGLSEWKPKLLAQLEAKDKIIEGLVGSQKKALAELCRGCPGAITDCENANCTGFTTATILRAAMAATEVLEARDENQ